MIPNFKEYVLVCLLLTKHDKVILQHGCLKQVKQRYALHFTVYNVSITFIKSR